MPGASILNYSSYQNFLVRYAYKVTKRKLFSIEDTIMQPESIKYKIDKLLVSSIDAYTSETSSSDIRYRQFTLKDKENKPLIIWFYGGDNNTVQLLASKSGSALASEEIQNIFDGAYVVIPQAPTFWTRTNLYNDSIYKKQMLDTINEIIENNLSIDKERIYIGDTFARRFMVWQMLTETSDLYDAFLVSAAHTPSKKEAKLSLD